MPVSLPDNLTFDQDGKFISLLKIPNSTNTSGWGSLLLPVIVVRNGNGLQYFLPEVIMVMNTKVRLPCGNWQMN